MDTIHLLPASTPGLDLKEYCDALTASYDIAPTLDFIPDSRETLGSIAYIDVKLMMDYNENFYRTAIELCPDFIAFMIARAREVSKQLIDKGDKSYVPIYERLKAAVTADDLLNSGYYGNDYEQARHEFVKCFVEDNDIQ